MVGVYDEAILHCRKCGRETPHSTGWESEEPDVLDTECKICGNKERR